MVTLYYYVDFWGRVYFPAWQVLRFREVAEVSKKKHPVMPGEDAWLDPPKNIPM